MTTQQFKELIIPEQQTMWKVAYAILGDEAEASDALQECMIKLWRLRDRLDGVTNIRAYCMGSIRNMAVGMAAQRRTGMLPIDVASESESETDSSRRAELRDVLAIVEREINRMPDSQREVMRMSSYGGLSNHEIAEATGLTDENVRTMLSRGRRKLKSLLKLHI